MTAPITGTFELVDHDGKPVTERAYRGSWMLVLFGFTHCKVVCPRALARFSIVLDELGDLATRVQALYITVDPERDSPAMMRAFLHDRHPRFVGLTGSPEQIERAKESFLVFARRRPDPGDPDGYQVPHTAIAYLLDPQGRYAAHWTDARDRSAVLAEMRDRLLGEGEAGRRASPGSR